MVSNKDKVSRVFDEKVLKKLRADGNSLPTSWRNMIFFIALFLMVVAMARPVIEKGEKRVEIEGLNMMIALDISGSMRVKDIYPNRLEFAKNKILEFLKYTPTDEIAVVAFASNAFMLAPMSSDKATLGYIVKNVDDKYISMSNTNFTTLGQISQEVLSNKKKKILVLFSDGGEKENLKGLKAILKQHNIILYTVLVGTKKGGVVVDENGDKVTDSEGNIAFSQRNDDLGELSLKSGGAYIVASSGDQDIAKLVEVIKSSNQNDKKAFANIKDREELFYYPLGASLLFLLLALSSLPTRRKS
jgi:Ca-activated chloride channel family protein